jgi:pyruvate dehydrogenase E1 component alpha subunit
MVKYNFFAGDVAKIIRELGPEKLIYQLNMMLLIRNFELGGETSYQQKKVGGFYHSYMGQEAIQVGCVAAAGLEHWYTTTYRCHALAMLLGATPDSMMAELYGRTTGLARGLGGSMHMYADHLLGGLAIVGGHVPIATGAAFSLKYLKKKGLASFCFMGDGAMAQGAVHESLNLAMLWNLPCIFVVENNFWGMGTAVNRAICVEPIAESFAKGYGMSSYTLDGVDFFSCYAGFQAALEEVKRTSKPVLIEAVAERFRGHSISDPGLYRSKEELKRVMGEKDPIQLFKETLIKHKVITEEQFKKMDDKAAEIIEQAIKFADQSPWPDSMSLEQGVFAPEDNTSSS